MPVEEAVAAAAAASAAAFALVLRGDQVAVTEAYLDVF